MCPPEKATLSAPVMVYLDSEQKAELERVAADEGRSLSNLIRRALGVYYAQREAA